jgi:hypothetical protein
MVARQEAPIVMLLLCKPSAVCAKYWSVGQTGWESVAFVMDRAVGIR